VACLEEEPVELLPDVTVWLLRDCVLLSVLTDAELRLDPVLLFPIAGADVRFSVC